MNMVRARRGRGGRAGAAAAPLQPNRELYQGRGHGRGRRGRGNASQVPSHQHQVLNQFFASNFSTFCYKEPEIVTNSHGEQHAKCIACNKDYAIQSNGVSVTYWRYYKDNIVEYTVYVFSIVYNIKYKYNKSYII